MERRSSLAARVLPDSVTLLASFAPVSDREGQAVVPDYWFDPTGANDAARFTLQSGESRWQVSAGGLGGTRMSGGAS
jgi:general secretion pathway protein H